MKLKEIQRKVDYQANEIDALIKEKILKDEQLRDKEKSIHNLKYKISELGKAKHVL
jgi:deoxyribose-phosphate aldolase